VALTVPADFSGGTVPTTLINQLIAGLRQAYGIRATKTTDETVTSSTTLQNDDELSVAVAANTTYKVKFWLTVFGAAAGDIKVALTFPTGSTCKTFGGLGMYNGSAAAATNADVEAHGYGSTSTSPTSSITFGVPDTNGIVLTCEATIAVGPTAGAITVQWAQGTSSGTGTTVKAGSYLHAYAD
jgi:hypothetical protein